MKNEGLGHATKDLDLFIFRVNLSKYKTSLLVSFIQNCSCWSWAWIFRQSRESGCLRGISDCWKINFGKIPKSSFDDLDHYPMDTACKQGNIFYSKPKSGKKLKGSGKGKNKKSLKISADDSVPSSLFLMCHSLPSLPSLFPHLCPLVSFILLPIFYSLFFFKGSLYKHGYFLLHR